MGDYSQNGLHLVKGLMKPQPIEELHTFRYSTDDQLLICLLFQRHHSSVCAVFTYNQTFLRQFSYF